ncbi:MAG: Rrf2 family transcriptional regulator [Bacteroidetes bacterium]|nr:Rrf2 family transcriptional regulator [Bacteroidota bacterium]MBS1934763.1 Rrf2 family transcriptional regulator [Bacteroidota bacterium]
MLSKKTQYAFQALMYLAQKENNEPVLIAEISKKKKIPLKFLENILLELKKAKILDSKKGKGGGYYFAKNPKDIQLATVMRLLDGPISLVSCVSLYFYEKCRNCDEKSCGLHDAMAQVRDANLRILEKKTIADIARK